MSTSSVTSTSLPKRKVHIKRKNCCNRKQCIHKNKCEDKPTKFASPGFRCLYVFISWILLIKASGDAQGYFVAQTMMCIPLFKEYLEYSPSTKARKYIKICAMLIVGICLLPAFSFLFGLLHVNIVDEISYLTITRNSLFKADFNFPLLYTWVFCSLLVLTTFADFVSVNTKEDIEVVNNFEGGLL